MTAFLNFIEFALHVAAYMALAFAAAGVLVAILLPVADRLIEGFRSLGARF